MSNSDTIERDNILITRAISGDGQAFRALLSHYQTAVYACTMAITRNQADASDAAQDAFIRFHKNMSQFDLSRPLKPYLLRIAANCSKNLIAKRTREQKIREVEVEDSKTLKSPQAEMMRGERNLAIRQLVEQLPNTLREVTSLFYLAECSCKEVAEILEMTESAVKVALHRARKKLHGDMQEWRTA